MLGWAGFDFVVIDLEHGYFGPESLPNLIRAAEVSGCAALVRVPKEAGEQIGKALDLGSAGIVVPGVTSASKARDLIALTRFAPEGRRGASISTRQLRYGARDFGGLLAEREAAAPLIVLQVEAQLVTGHLDEILALEHLDVLFIGPFDLSASLGVGGRLEDPHVLAAMRDIVARAAAKGVTLGTWMPDAAQARTWLAQGVRFMTVSNNELMFYRAARQIREALSEPQSGGELRARPSVT